MAVVLSTYAIPWPLEMRLAPRLFLLGYFLLNNAARADYAWIPEYMKLVGKVGLDFARSSENFDSQGARTNIVTGGSTASFSETRFWIEPEYGVAQDWTIGGRFSIVSGSVGGTSSTLLSGAGLGDTLLFLKYGLSPAAPLLTLEVKAKFPSGSSTASAVDDLVVGDGNFDFGFVLHTGQKSGKMAFSLSPGFVARFGGYAPAATLDAAVQFNFPRGYVRAFGNGFVSFQESLLGDSAADSHDANGTGGTYARLAGSPTSVALGGLIGVKAIDDLAVEGAFSHTLFGLRAAHGLKVTFLIKATFDFYKSPRIKRVREIPLDAESGDKFYQNR